MTRYIFAAFGVVAAGAIAGAQTPSPSQPSTTSQRGDQITVTGCLKPWTGNAAATGAATSTSTPTASASTAAARYILTDAEKKDGSGTSAMQTPRAGEAGSMAGAVTKNDDQYLLEAETGSVNLSQHVNHKVEVTGHKSATSMSSETAARTDERPTGGTTVTGQPRPAGQDGHKTAPATLVVSSLKMVAATCN